jgi:DNA-binding LacI/PurR family transcriptional regulator
MTKSFVTLDDIATAAGLSRAQVSRALSGGQGVRPETRKLVDAVAAQLNYQPNLAARSLASARSSIVGLVIGDLQNPFHIQLAEAVDRELTDAGFDPVTSLRTVGHPNIIAERLLRLRATGVVMIGTHHTTRAIADIAEKMPCVYIGSKRISHPRVTAIAVDDESGVRQAMAHLLGLGHTRIVNLGGGNIEASARQRTKVYATVMQEAGLKPVSFQGLHDVASGRRGVDLAFAGGERPTAIFASNDCIALGAIDRLKGMGLSVPEDVSVIGFDDIPDAKTEVFSLSTIRQDCDMQARSAVDALKAILAGSQSGSRQRIMPVKMIIRRSTAAPKIA